MRTVLALVALALVLGACGDDSTASDRSTNGSDPTDSASRSTSEASSTPSDPGDDLAFDEALFPGEIEPALQPQIEQARTDLASRLEVDTSEIDAVSATSVTWSNGSLGCPDPGLLYTQALQDGALIELGHAGPGGSRVYRYHVGGPGTTPFVCDRSRAVPPVPRG